MRKLPGRKVGKLCVWLKRDRGYRRGQGSVMKPLNLDDKGWFHSEHDGISYKAQTQADLEEQLRAAIEKSISLEWDRYLVVNYEAEAHPLVAGTRRAQEYGQVLRLGISDRRTNPLTLCRYRRGDEYAEECAITSIGLKWDVVEYSRPYAVPEREGMIRSVRAVHAAKPDSEREAERVEHFGDPRELSDDVLPSGAVLYTPEREAILLGIAEAMRALDERLANLFAGPVDELAAKLDGMSLDRLLPRGWS